MRNGERIETARTDLATLLGNLASQLRNDGLALTGMATLESNPGEVKYRDLTELMGSLERTASLMEAVKDRLCQKCRMQGVAEHVTFGMEPEDGQRSQLKGEWRRGKGKKAGN